MPKRVPLDTDLFKVELPQPQRDPLDSLIPATAPVVQPSEEKPYQEQKSVVELKTERSNERTIERTNVREVKKKQRIKVRHTFDVFKDQLVELQGVQFAAVQVGRRKPKLGDMVQQAIDLFLKKKRG